MCKYCPGKIDDAEHTFFECKRWGNYRANAEATIGKKLNPTSLVNLMIQREETWNEIAAYARRLLIDKISERDK